MRDTNCLTVMLSLLAMKSAEVSSSMPSRRVGSEAPRLISLLLGCLVVGAFDVTVGCSATVGVTATDGAAGMEAGGTKGGEGSDGVAIELADDEIEATADI